MSILTDPASEYAGNALRIDVNDPNHILGRLAKLSHVRPGRVPSRLERTVLLDNSGNGRFYGWTPAGMSEIILEIAGSFEPELRGPSVTVRRVNLSWIALRITLHAPWAMLQTFRLLLAGNTRGFRYRFGRLFESLNEPTYDGWQAVAEAAYPESGAVDRPPVFITIAGGDGDDAEETRRSIARQTYRNVRLVGVGSETAAIAKANALIFWMRLAAGTRLHPRAVEQLMQPLLADDTIAAAYGDEDRIDPKGRRFAPFFKPAWNPPLAETGWLAPDGAIIRMSALGPNLDPDRANAGKILLEASTHGKIVHVPRVLLHRRQLRPPVTPSVAKRRLGCTKVSVIIPTRDRSDLLRTCLEGLFKKTRFDDLDVIVIDNESREPATLALFAEYEESWLIRRIPLAGSFNFAHACNRGVENARHELVLLLNNDVEPMEPEWLDQMVAELDDEDIGIAGAMLFFPDGFVQHAGVTLGSGSVARHSFQFRKPGTGEDLGLLEQRQEMSAVTAACLLTRRSLWQAVGGMDEEHLAVAFNDVDYCLKVREIGKAVMWTPHARLFHRESVSRGKDDTPEKLARFASEEAFMHERWGDILANDPFYNPNLSLVVGDHSLDVQPRDLSPRFGSLAGRK